MRLSLVFRGQRGSRSQQYNREAVPNSGASCPFSAADPGRATGRDGSSGFGGHSFQTVDKVAATEKQPGIDDLAQFTAKVPAK
jgi:hypothetical protein